MPPAERLAVLSGLMAVEAGQQPPVASVNRQSLREESEGLKGRFGQLGADGKITAESRALIAALLMLLSVLMAVFMENNTRKTSANSSK